MRSWLAWRYCCITPSIAAITVLTACSSGGGGSDSDAAPASSSATATATATASTTAPVKVAPITGVSFDWSSHRRSAEGSDNWPATWSDDDHQYAIWGDGGGFGGTEEDGRASLGVARIEGDARNYQGINRLGGVVGECQSNIDAKAHGAPLSIGGVLYAWLTPGSGPQEYAVFTLYRSRDKGCSWTELDTQFQRPRDGISFGSFVQFGKDNAAARDAYVYTVAVEVSDDSALNIVQRPGKIMLLRVPRDAIEDRGAYEFYAGQSSTGEATWSAQSSERLAIYEDSDGVGPFPQMSYVPGLDRVVYTNQHGNGTDAAGMQSLLTMAEAPQPWGPWNVIYHDVFFPEIERTVFQWNFAPKWFGNDGRDFTLIFSGVDGNDSWNSIEGTFATSQ